MSWLDKQKSWPRGLMFAMHGTRQCSWHPFAWGAMRRQTSHGRPQQERTMSVFLTVVIIYYLIKADSGQYRWKMSSTAPIHTHTPYIFILVHPLTRTIQLQVIKKGPMKSKWAYGFGANMETSSWRVGNPWVLPGSCSMNQHYKSLISFRDSSDPKSDDHDDQRPRSPLSQV